MRTTAALDDFGASVAIDGDVIVVGSPGSNEHVAHHGRGVRVPQQEAR
ncbi:MAG: hypothetical protein R2713_02615 [Ilumatobacteraceae bacterium]